ncbi:hypothetical protein V493_02589 [Pseudogymnoascus sp. VKM F-4281 (FW-2241)]|nr:hypothetical protein V493_02589 [Pseudogymnoascus sp. VKM F-4281 (FW-2241)]
MASDYGTYLAANILNEDRIVTYRLLSRALKVHVNIAKEMLFEFHQQQNRKKPGTVYASYLIAGKKLPTDQQKANYVEGADREAGYMGSSPPFRSTPQAGALESNEDIPILSITLVREGDLEQARKNYESISSIHVYCLGPSLMKDPEALSDANREIIENYRDQDPLEVASTYGTVINKTVRRRAGHRAATSASVAPPPAPKATAGTLKAEPKAEPKAVISEPKPNPAVSLTSSAKASKGFFGKTVPKGDAPATKDTPAPRNTAVTNRKDSGGIFASFAKAKQPIVKYEAAADISEDSPMKDASDDEEETYVPPPSKPKKDVQEDRESRKEREAALMQMMEEDDEEEEPSLSTVPQDAPEKEDKESMSPDVLPTTSQDPQEHMEVSGGRRRGRRRVMKKITTKDDEGYLVTKEEPSWESFSEDEPVIRAKPSIPSTSSGPKSKKPAGKPGQGNIMAFFAKKT